MKLYHTGTTPIPFPDVRHGRVNADFGQGFYLTPDADFTYRWARQKAVVNEYELDISGLLVHRFTRDSEWFDYIYHNRRAIDNITADVIIGPIANDTVFDTFGLISSGYLKVEDALSLLRIGPEYTQVAIKTQKAVKQLKWITSSIVEDVAEHQAALKDEKARYDALFSEEVNRIISSGIV